MSKSPYLWCRAADTGFAMFMTTDGPVLYDVQAGTSIPLPGTALGATCSVTSDGDWLVSGSLPVDLKGGTGALLPPYDSKAEQPTTLPSSGIAREQDFTNYRWSGPQDVTASQSR